MGLPNVSVNVSGDKHLSLTSTSPFAVQWVFPIPLAILLFFAPESPWWLVGKGRLEEAKRSIERLGVQATSSSSEVLSMIVRTTEIERAATAGARWLDMFKGIDRRRTL